MKKIHSPEPSGSTIAIKQINPLSIQENMSELHKIAKEGFGIDMSESDVREHILLSDQVFLFLDGDKIVGFSSIQFFHGVIYRYGTVIHPDYQNRGLYSRLNQEHFSSKVSMILRTQNLRIIDAHRASGREVHLGQDALSELDKIGITRVHLERVGKNLDQNGVFKGAYGGKLGTEATMDPVTSDHSTGFEADKGDALLVYIR